MKEGGGDNLLGGAQRADKSDVARALRAGLVTWAATEFREGLRHAETYCWKCGREHGMNADKCPHCGEDLIPF